MRYPASLTSTTSPSPADRNASRPNQKINYVTALMEPHRVRWHWTDGPGGNPNTEDAERLAVEGRRQAIGAISDDAECVHEMPLRWCSLCKPPKPGVRPYGYRTKGGRAYHNDPDCTWLDRGQRRADRQGKNVHDKVRIAWADVNPGELEPCESCCTPQWLVRHGYRSADG